ncbi:hypothetical protein [Methylovulum psychrotolerans]|uniref:hypothetical protein n=1 Tax=Methylovulum psychrotolerans TaxID=1704499 RepID=UPI0011B055A5|nr:hypothetical protein [Methylovulum psychrotolerans]
MMVRRKINGFSKCEKFSIERINVANKLITAKKYTPKKTSRYPRLLYALKAPLVPSAKRTVIIAAKNPSIVKANVAVTIDMLTRCPNSPNAKLMFLSQINE